MRLAILAGSLALSGASAAPPVLDIPPSAEPAVVKSPPLSAEEEARRDALTRYGVGLLRARHLNATRAGSTRGSSRSSNAKRS